MLYIPLIESHYQTSLGSSRIDYIRRINEKVDLQLKAVEGVVTVGAPTFERRDFSFDGLHLSKRGYQRLRGAIVDALTSSEGLRGDLNSWTRAQPCSSLA